MTKAPAKCRILFHPMPLEPEDLHHLRVAEGYIDLGMFLDANEELEQIDPDVRHLPEVLAQRCRIYGALKKWDLLQVVSRKLVACNPADIQAWVRLAFATRRAESLAAAKEILLEGLKRNPGIDNFHFNLACYECQLGNLDAAKEHLSQAITLDKKWQMRALEDEDLEPLWAAFAMNVVGYPDIADQ